MWAKEEKEENQKADPAGGTKGSRLCGGNDQKATKGQQPLPEERKRRNVHLKGIEKRQKWDVTKSKNFLFGGPQRDENGGNKSRGSQGVSGWDRPTAQSMNDG